MASLKKRAKKKVILIFILIVEVSSKVLSIFLLSFTRAALWIIILKNPCV